MRVWDVATGQGQHTLTGHVGEVWSVIGMARSVVFSPDGLTLASAGSDSTVRMWDVATGEEKSTLTGHGTIVYSVVFSPDGSTLASGGNDPTVRLWDMAAGQDIRILTGHRTFPLDQFGGVFT